MPKDIEKPPTSIDNLYVTSREFYPRKSAGSSTPEGIEAILFPIDDHISISGRFCMYARDAPTILFFHGNGEIAADYEDIGPKFGMECGVNLLALDYRGYGESSGTPSNSTMISDARALFPQVKKYLESQQISTPIIVMGRSLGSASAIEIALHYETQLAGLVLESAYARVEPLLTLFGISSQLIARMDLTSLENVVKMRNVHLPLLVLHGEDDSLIPAAHGRELFETSPAINKKLIIIPDAEHNTILLYEQYFVALTDWLKSIA